MNGASTLKQEPVILASDRLPSCVTTNQTSNRTSPSVCIGPGNPDEKASKQMPPNPTPPSLSSNLNIHAEQALHSPEVLRKQIPINTRLSRFITRARQQIADVISGKDNRLMVICGPCSIHDLAAAKEYAEKFKALSDKTADRILMVMRVYFEKPRSTVGWKGLINDPDLDGSCNVEKGLTLARQLLLDMAQLNIPVATEVLDPVSPQYLSDLISWAAIGARTTESQTHRELASGLQMPVGFKNGTDGGISVAINALKAAKSEHRFLGLNKKGQVAVIHSKGNQHGHVILRGGKAPNYHAQAVKEVAQQLKQHDLNPRLLIDCSHGNSNKDHQLQPLVARNVLTQIQAGNQDIMGIMLESHLEAGAQKITNNAPLHYGVSVTDACIDWNTTETLIKELYDGL